MPQRTIALIANDYLESKLMTDLAPALLAAGLQCTTLVNHGKFPSLLKKDAIRNLIATSDMVAIALSEDSPEEQFAADTACQYGKQLVVLALSYGRWSTLNALAREHARLLFVLNKLEQAKAQALYPAAAVVASGHPEWESFFLPKHDRAAVRNALEVAPGQTCVLVSGEKEAAVNMPLAVSVIEAIADLPNRNDYRVIFTVHPGHVPLPGNASLLAFYHELERYHPEVAVRASCKTVPFGISTNDMMAGADIVIGTNSTVQILAACRRIPTIAILLRRAFRGVTLPSEHHGWWPPCDCGAIAPVYGLDTSRTSTLIQEVLTPQGFAPMRLAQEQCFPRAETGHALSLISEVVGAL